jgi:RimJ/RimL family protein N-acetyltransferase
MVAPMAAYPIELERDIVLRDGARLRLRPIRSDDHGRLIALYDRLSRHTAYQRFFSVMRRLPPDWARWLADVDYQRRLALLAEHDEPGGPELVAVARYEPTDHEDTIMLDALLAAAEARGIRRFRAYVLAGNARMIDLLVRFTDVRERRTESGVTELLLTRRPCELTDRRR